MAEIITVIASKEIHKRFDLGWLNVTTMPPQKGGFSLMKACDYTYLHLDKI